MEVVASHPSVPPFAEKGAAGLIWAQRVRIWPSFTPLIRLRALICSEVVRRSHSLFMESRTEEGFRLLGGADLLSIFAVAQTRNQVSITILAAT